MSTFKTLRIAAIAAVCAMLASCAGGEEGTPTNPNAPPPTTTNDKPTPTEASRFLTSATFGPTQFDINRLVDIGYSAWFREQYAIPPTTIVSTLPVDARYRETISPWWRSAVYGNDQLRQRAAFALSQVFVISASDSQVERRGHSIGRYMDILQEGAFGSYRDLLENVTYSPSMGTFLTYIGNEKADAEEGSVPDENYAREVMQLFTIGVVELNPDGTPRRDGQGQVIETYDNSDITELAKVFTGLWWADLRFRRDNNLITPEVQRSAMTMNDDAHSTASKTFLGMTIPADTPGDESIRLALDHLVDHPNTAPFLASQLIQRFTTSNPSPAYVRRVRDVFASGLFTLPDGTVVGDGARGNMQAVLAAVLLDPEALSPDSINDPTYGKVREPVVRLAHWARAFNINSANADELSLTRDMGRPDRLNQQPLLAPSVFNFYRPGYVAPGTETANAGLVAPELQIADTTSVIGYGNFMDNIVRRQSNPDRDDNVFLPDYSAEIALSEDVPALLDRLNLILMAGRMRQSTRDRITDALDLVRGEDDAEEARRRVEVAVYMAVTSPEFTVQR